MNSTYVAKYLWRDDITGAKWRLNEIYDCGLREALNWYAAMEKGWMWKPGSIGRGLAKALDPDTRAELIASFAGGENDDLWESLFHTTALYRKAVIKVGEELGFAYPHDLDARVTAFHQTLRTLGKTASREELAEILGKKYHDRA